MPDLLTRARAAMAATAVLLAMALSAASAPAAVPASPEDAAWRALAPMAGSFLTHGTAVLGDGDLLAIGFFVDGTPGAQRYDTATGAWSTTPAPRAVRYRATATVLADGRVLWLGGSDVNTTTLDSGEIYDPRTGSWSDTAPMSVARDHHSATLLADGTVLVAGGAEGFSGVHASAERYAPATDTWSPAGTLPRASAGHAAVRMPDGAVMVMGGYDPSDPDATYDPIADVARYDPGSGTWTQLAPMPGGRQSAAALVLPDGRVLVVGGNTFLMTPTATTSAATYDPAQGGWTPVLLPRHFHQPYAALLPSGRLLVLDIAEGSSMLIDPRTWTGRDVEPSGHYRDYAGRYAQMLDGSVALIGGDHRAGTVQRFVERAAIRVASADFGEVAAGHRSPLLDVRVASSGQIPLFASTVQVEGPHAADFALVSQDCTGAAVPFDGACTARIRFTPGAVGARSASLVVAGDQLASGRVSAALGGTGAAPGVAPPAATLPGRARAPRRAALPRLRCAARRGRAVRCTGLPRRFGRGRVRLMRDGTLYATGRLRDGRLRLTIHRRLFSRRYTLIVVSGRAASKVVLD